MARIGSKYFYMALLLHLNAMARILYTVCGVGLGHATRSAEVIKELRKKHEVMIASYGSALEYLEERFENASELQWFELVYDEEIYHKGKTFLKMVPNIPLVAAKNFMTLAKIVREFKPEVIVSDFDVNSVYLGDLFRIPTLTLSSMHIMSRHSPPRSMCWCLTSSSRKSRK
jgi:uncharacterized protein (TIGR00661 family)